jgi:hypothetical protein
VARIVSPNLQREIDAGIPDVQAQVWLCPPLPQSHRERHQQIMGLLRTVNRQTGLRPNRVELVRWQPKEPATTFWIDAPAEYMAQLTAAKEVDIAWIARNIELLSSRLIVKGMNPWHQHWDHLKSILDWPNRNQPAAARAGRAVDLTDLDI